MPNSSKDGLGENDVDSYHEYLSQLTNFSCYKTNPIMFPKCVAKTSVKKPSQAVKEYIVHDV